MTGTEYQPGVIPMAIQEIFDYVEDVRLHMGGSL